MTNDGELCLLPVRRTSVDKGAEEAMSTQSTQEKAWAVEKFFNGRSAPCLQGYAMCSGRDAVQTCLSFPYHNIDAHGATVRRVGRDYTVWCNGEMRMRLREMET